MLRGKGHGVGLVRCTCQDLHARWLASRAPFREHSIPANRVPRRFPSLASFPPRVRRGIAARLGMYNRLLRSDLLGSLERFGESHSTKCTLNTFAASRWQRMPACVSYMGSLLPTSQQREGWAGGQTHARRLHVQLISFPQRTLLSEFRSGRAPILPVQTLAWPSTIISPRGPVRTRSTIQRNAKRSSDVMKASALRWDHRTVGESVLGGVGRCLSNGLLNLDNLAGARATNLAGRGLLAATLRAQERRGADNGNYSR